MNMILKSPTISPVYLILGGLKPTEGAVISKSAGGVVNITQLGNNSVTPKYVALTCVMEIVYVSMYVVITS